MSHRTRLLRVPGALLLLAATACGADDDDVAATGTDSVRGDITVFAAASLAGPFSDVGAAFEEAHPDTSVTFSFDGSSTLVQQIVEGAPADAFASADSPNMDKLVVAGLAAAEPAVFAINRLAIVVAPGNPLGITDVSDLADSDVVTVVCAPEVPCGRYADQVLTAAGVDVTPASYEENVRGVVTKVTEGEADAGIVYVTDVIAAGGAAELVEIREDVNVTAEYPIAPVAGSDEQDVAEAFIDFLTGTEGRAILADHGFGSP